MAPRDFQTRLARRASRAGLFLPEDLIAGLTAYYELLSRWNRKINLTSLDNPDEAIDRLLLEPVIAARHFRESDVRVMDVGSGGGSPSIPMKLALPAMRLTMVEAKARKSAFLREAIRHLSLSDIVVENSRYEELLARPELHEAFGVVSLRAVRVESRALVTFQAFLEPGGLVFLFRGPSGPEVPATLMPPLEWAGTHPLVEALQSRLTVLIKRPLGMDVPRGTSAVPSGN